MTLKTIATTYEKLSTVWSSRQEREIAVRIQYEVREVAGCKVYKLGTVEELA